jgi:hypothetical protein
MSNLSRRSLVTSAAALPALALPAVAVAAVVGDDTFARIAEHHRLTALEDDVCHRISMLESELPKERRTPRTIFDYGTDLGKGDDPRWTAIQAEYWAACDAKDEIAWSLVDRPPISAAGLAALFAYADEHEAAGYLWPDSRHYFTANGTYDHMVEEDWRRSLMTSAASVLQTLAIN